MTPLTNASPRSELLAQAAGAVPGPSDPAEASATARNRPLRPPELPRPGSKMPLAQAGPTTLDPVIPDAAFQSPQSFEQRLQQWVEAAPVDERTSRSQAATRMSEVCANPDLSTLNLSGLKLDSLPDCIEELTSLRQLTVFNCQLSTLPRLPPSLTGLDACDNHLIELPAELPRGLTELLVDDNRLLKLPTLPSTLVTLNARRNALLELPLLPTTLASLRVDHNELVTLPELYETSLTKLNAGFNSLGSLPPLPPSLQRLNVKSNLLDAMPALPDSLVKLNVSLNRITSLPALPGSLEVLYAFDNQLTSVPAFPASLTCAGLQGNREAQLPMVPTSSLKTLYADKVVVEREVLDSRRKLTVFNDCLTLNHHPRPDYPSIPERDPVQAGSGSSSINLTDLPDRILDSITDCFAPGSDSAARLAATNKQLMAPLQERVDADKQSALAFRIPQLEAKITYLSNLRND